MGVVMEVGPSKYCFYVVAHLLLAARRARLMVHGEKKCFTRNGILDSNFKVNMEKESFWSLAHEQIRNPIVIFQSLLLALTPTATARYWERGDNEDSISTEEDEIPNSHDSGSRVLYCADSFYSAHGR